MATLPQTRAPLAPATDQAAMRKFVRARGALCVTKAFYGVLAQHLIPRVDRADGVTMWTDGEHIGFSPEFVMSLSDPELRGVIAHEVEHIARLHHTRRGKRDHEMWNNSADYAINGDLITGGFKLPAGGLIDPQYKNMSAEAIYAKRAKAKAKQEQQAQASSQGRAAPQGGAGQPDPQGKPRAGQGPAQPSAGAPTPAAGSPGPSQGPGKPTNAPGQPGQAQGPGRNGTGQGQGNGAPRPWGEVRDAPGGEAAKAEAESKAARHVKQAALAAKAQGAGALPGYAEELIRELDRPVIDWRGQLRRFADDSTIRETCWTRPNRRHQGEDFILPGSESVAPSHLVLGVDCSGSMDAKALAAIGGELQSMLDDRAAERLTVLFFDTTIHRVETYAPGDVFTLRAVGRGGTAFAPAFKWVEDNAPNCSAIIMLTDMDNYDVGSLRDPGVPVLWANTDRPRAAPFGEVIQIDANA